MFYLWSSQLREEAVLQKSDTVSCLGQRTKYIIGCPWRWFGIYMTSVQRWFRWSRGRSIKTSQTYSCLWLVKATVSPSGLEWLGC